jgi:hypothetical protein
MIAYTHMHTSETNFSYLIVCIDCILQIFIFHVLKEEQVKQIWNKSIILNYSYFSLGEGSLLKCEKMQLLASPCLSICLRIIFRMKFQFLISCIKVCFMCFCLSLYYHLSICQHATTQEPLNRFSQYLILGSFTKICQYIQLMVEI